jgi:hypothetical protein
MMRCGALPVTRPALATGRGVFVECAGCCLPRRADFGDNRLASSRVRAWRVSITLEAGFGIEALEKVLTRFGKPTSSTRTREAN